MSDVRNYCCDRCGTAIEGSSLLCVSCFYELHAPCPHCMRCAFNGGWRPIKVRSGGRLQDKPCHFCKDERWILRSYVPFGGTAPPEDSAAKPR